MSGIVRAGAVALVAAGLAVGATRVSGSVQLATPGERAGLPESSSVLRRRRLARVPGPAAPRRHRPAGRRRAPSRSLQRPPTPGSSPARPAGGSGSVAAARRTVVDRSGPDLRPGRGRLGRGRAPPTSSSPGRAGALAPGLVATQVWRHAGDDDRGLTVTPCQLPSSDVWLVGGGGGPSRTERVIVSNPGANAVSVSFEVLGTRGAASTRPATAASPSRRCRARSSRSTPSRPTRPVPVVHVTATGGVVSAVLDEQWILGATGRGIDDATRAASPGTDLVVPGVETGGGDLAAPGQPRRHRGPGPGAAAHRQGCGAARGPPGRPRAGRLDARRGRSRPTRRPWVSASGPTSRSWRRPGPSAGRPPADQMGDFAWTPATPALRGVAGVLLPGLDGTTKRLLLTAGSAPATAQVRLGTGDGAQVSTVDVPADSTVAVDVEGRRRACGSCRRSGHAARRRLRGRGRRGSAVLLGGLAQRRARAGPVGAGASGAQLTRRRPAGPVPAPVTRRSRGRAPRETTPSRPGDLLRHDVGDERSDVATVGDPRLDGPTVDDDPRRTRARRRVEPAERHLAVVPRGRVRGARPRRRTPLRERHARTSPRAGRRRRGRSRRTRRGARSWPGPAARPVARGGHVRAGHADDDARECGARRCPRPHSRSTGHGSRRRHPAAYALGDLVLGRRGDSSSSGGRTRVPDRGSDTWLLEDGMRPSRRRDPDLRVRRPRRRRGPARDLRRAAHLRPVSRARRAHDRSPWLGGRARGWRLPRAGPRRRRPPRPGRRRARGRPPAHEPPGRAPHDAHAARPSAEADSGAVESGRRGHLRILKDS